MSWLFHEQNEVSSENSESGWLAFCVPDTLPHYITQPVPVSPCRGLGFKEGCFSWGVWRKGGWEDGLGFAAHSREQEMAWAVKSQAPGDWTPGQEGHELRSYFLRVTCLDLVAPCWCHQVAVGKSLCSSPFRLSVDNNAILFSFAYSKTQQICWHNFHWI